MKLRCECCDFEQDFVDGQAAFDAGWDAPPWFTGYVCCDLCPGSFVVIARKEVNDLGITHQHEKAHKIWAIEGRPRQFDPNMVD